MPGESPFNAACEYRAAGPFLDILVPADMVGIAMGVDDAFDAPSVLSGNLQYLLRGLPVVSAVDEIDLVSRLPVYAYLRRAVYVGALRTYLFQFVHKDLFAAICEDRENYGSVQASSPRRMIQKDVTILRRIVTGFY